jgi:predicted restriction endonuclease
MEKLEEFLDCYDNMDIYNNLLSDYTKFGYDNSELFHYHLQFLLENCYNINIITTKSKRLNQKEFRESILKKYNNMCVVSNNDCIVELTAAHIIPVSEEDNYEEDNGLLLTETLHKTFDKYYWSINPNTMKIEINTNVNVGQIKQYNGMRLQLDMNSIMKSKIIWHYNMFLKEKMK